MKKNFLLISVSTLVFVVVGYVINIFLARSLGPKEYGIYGVVVSVITLINLIQISGVPQAMSKYISSMEKDNMDILYKSLMLQLILTSIITILYFNLINFIGSLLGDINLIFYLKISTMIFPLYGMFVLYADYYNGMHLFNKQSFVNILYSLSKLIAIIVLTYFYGLTGALLGFVLAPFVPLLFAFKAPQKNDNLVNKSVGFKQILLYSIPLVIFAFFSNLLQSIDLYFIKASSIAEQNVGYYVASQNISRIPYFALSAFSVVMFPSISKSVSEKNKGKTDQLIKESLRYILLLLVPITLLISAFSKEILTLLFSSTYDHGAASLGILTLALGMLTLFNFYGNILNGGGHPKITVWSAVIGVSVTSLVCYLLIPTRGMIGAALGTLSGSIVTLLIAGNSVHRKFNVHFPTINSIRIVGSGTLVYLIGNYLHLSPTLTPIVMMFLFGIYILILIVMKEINRNDIERLFAFFPLRKK